VPIHSLGYLRLESTDLDAWKTFAGDFLGLMPVARDDDESLRYRMDYYPPRLVVSPGAEDRASAIGFEVLNERDLNRTVAAVEDAGIKVIEGTRAECEDRRVTGFARFDDPGGNPIELFYGPVLDHKPPEKVLEGVREVQAGKSFCLSLPLDFPGGSALNQRRYPPITRPTEDLAHKEDVFYNVVAKDSLDPAYIDVWSDDMVTLWTQYSTQ
jgi:catechol 2,3-dioxygenase-like lactoylglutathione lyase family enzyme